MATYTQNKNRAELADKKWHDLGIQAQMFWVLAGKGGVCAFLLKLISIEGQANTFGGHIALIILMRAQEGSEVFNNSR